MPRKFDGGGDWDKLKVGEEVLCSKCNARRKVTGIRAPSLMRTLKEEAFKLRRPIETYILDCGHESHLFG